MKRRTVVVIFGIFDIIRNDLIVNKDNRQTIRGWSARVRAHSGRMRGCMSGMR